jgi:uncharacterized protein YrrD
MLLELSKTKNLPVGALNEQKAVGLVEMPVVFADDAKVIGFLVKMKGVFQGKKVVSFSDVVDLDTKGLVINSADSLLAVDEILRIKDILKSGFKLVGLPARTKNKKYIGRISDVVIETTSGDIIRLYVQSLFDQRIFERSMIHDITSKEVILTFDNKNRTEKKNPVADQQKAAEAA